MIKNLNEMKKRVNLILDSMEKLNLALPENKKLEKIQIISNTNILFVKNGDNHEHSAQCPERSFSEGNRNENGKEGNGGSNIPSNDKKNIEKYPKSGVEEKQGQRPTMEDTHVVIDCVKNYYQNLKEHFPEHMAFYGVFDGHGGNVTSHLLQTMLHNRLFNNPHFYSHKQVKKAIFDVFLETDKIILDKSRIERWRDGATAVCCMIIGSKLFTFNVGDSEAVLARRSKISEFSEEDESNDPDLCISSSFSPFEAILLSKKHQPDDESEKFRIQQAGGYVYFGRVSGSLAVSRAFGDLDFKAQPHVIAEPFISEIELGENDEFLVIACDGLWDVFSYSEAVDYVASRREIDNISPQQAAEELVYDAIYKRGSSDNVSCIVVYLMPHKPYHK